VLATAIAAEADFIVSGDAHLLDLGIHAGIVILTASELLQKIR
jgi:predicted nucleic acid-binding protein